MNKDFLRSLGVGLPDEEIDSLMKRGSLRLSGEGALGQCKVEITLPVEVETKSYMPLDGASLCTYSEATQKEDCNDSGLARDYIAVWEGTADKGHYGAADWNNVGCAYIWGRPKSKQAWEQARAAFETALTKCLEVHKEKIQTNLNGVRKVIESLRTIELVVQPRDAKRLLEAWGKKNQNVRIDDDLSAEFGRS